MDYYFAIKDPYLQVVPDVYSMRKTYGSVCSRIKIGSIY